MVLPDKVYNVLKWVGLIVCPALGTFYATVGPAWGWPNVEAVKTTALALGALIGACIGVSAMGYTKES